MDSALLEVLHLSNAMTASLRSLCQFTVGVIAAALIVRTWAIVGIIEPVVVSGSSMAPTLLGPCIVYSCRECHYRFPVGVDQQAADGAALCPACGLRKSRPIDVKAQAGERFKIDRSAFIFRDPERWEIVVFRCPQQAEQFCVKRVLGLPNESIEFADGDLLIDGKLIRKSLAEQRAMRHLIDTSDIAENNLSQRIDNVIVPTLVHWQIDDSQLAVGDAQTSASKWLHYRHPGGGHITDAWSYNQSPAQVHHMNDLMLTCTASLTGEGALILSAANRYGRFEATIDFGLGRASVRRGHQILRESDLPLLAATPAKAHEWTLSLFDQQVLVARDENVIFQFDVGVDEGSNGQTTKTALALGIRGDLTGTIQQLSVWRDVYYAARHGDRPQFVDNRAARDFAWPDPIGPGRVAKWQLGPGEYFVVGDNAAISDDSRSWASGPGVPAKLLIGTPLGVR